MSEVIFTDDQHFAAAIAGSESLTSEPDRLIHRNGFISETGDRLNGDSQRKIFTRIQFTEGDEETVEERVEERRT